MNKTAWIFSYKLKKGNAMKKIAAISGTAISISFNLTA